MFPKLLYYAYHGYHPEHLTAELKKIYPHILTKIKFELSEKPSKKHKIVTKIQFELSTKPSKQEKAAQGKSGFVPAVAGVGD